MLGEGRSTDDGKICGVFNFALGLVTSPFPLITSRLPTQFPVALVSNYVSTDPGSHQAPAKRVPGTWSSFRGSRC
jgi:hypothetical protein